MLLIDMGTGMCMGMLSVSDRIVVNQPKLFTDSN